MDRQEIMKKLAEHRKKIQNHGVKQLELAGSYAQGTADDESDIDIVIRFEQGRGGYKDYTGLLHFLEDLFDRDIDLIKRELVREELKESLLGDAVATPI